MPFSTGQWRFCKLKKIRAKFFLTAFVASTLILAPLTAGDSSMAATPKTAKAGLELLSVKGKAPKTGYERAAFSDGWGEVGGCDLRNIILRRDLSSITFRDSCKVDTGILRDPYTNKVIKFKYGVGTSSAVQIDHVVAVSDAWQKGAQQIGAAKRYSFYNDPLNLLAVDGPTNSSKSDSDASAWLPPNKAYRCSFVARQIAVKLKYKLWIIQAEKAAMQRVLASCPTQKLPTT
jgi:hypothetical protein